MSTHIENLIVVGGGFSGKLAAIAASKYVGKVIIVEKNELGLGRVSIDVQQKDHVHVLLNRGLKEIERIYPDFSKELIKNNTIQYDMKRDFHWEHYGGEKYRYNSNFVTFQQSRKLVEDVLSEHVRTIPNISTDYNTKFIDFIHNKKNNKKPSILGITVRKGNGKIEMYADGVVFAVGNPALTKKKIVPKVKSTINQLGLYYHSRNYKLDNFDEEWKALACSPLFPTKLFGGVVLKNENNEYTLTLSQYHQSKPILDKETILSKLDNKKILEFTKNAQAVSEWKKYSIPQIEFLHIKKVKMKPLNVFIMGNAYCSFDPIFAQGLTVSATQVSVFQEALKKSLNIEECSNYYYKHAEKIIKNALELTYAETAQLSKNISLVNKLRHKIIVYFSEMSTYDKEILDNFVEVMHFDKRIKNIITIKNILKFAKHILIKRRITND